MNKYEEHQKYAWFRRLRPYSRIRVCAQCAITMHHMIGNYNTEYYTPDWSYILCSTSCHQYTAIPFRQPPECGH